MSDESAFLAALAASPADPLPRLAYADWLEERADPRHELIRVCEAMRKVPVFSDEYWRLKARRNELRPGFPADWLAATGCDGSRYDAIFRDGVPDGWRERWRLIREFTERWHGVPMPDVGGRAAEIAATEAGLRLTLPPSVREYTAYRHDLSMFSDHFVLDSYPVSMVTIPGQEAVSICLNESDQPLGVRLTNFNQPDPPVHNCTWRNDAMPEEICEQGQAADTVTRFVLRNVMSRMQTAGWCRAMVQDVNRLQKQLEQSGLYHYNDGDCGVFESDRGVLVSCFPEHSGRGVRLDVDVGKHVMWEAVPEFIWEYARGTAMRKLMFFTEDEVAYMRQAVDSSLPDAVPPMRNISRV